MQQIKIEEFFNFMVERHNIYLLSKVEKLPKPWTQDKILQNYKFCNVYRELDSVTIWSKEHIRDRWSKCPYLWFALCVLRRINWPETLEDLDDLLIYWDPAEAEAILNYRKDNKKKIYNGSYMLTTGGKAVPKNYHTCFNILNQLWEKRFEITKRLRECQTLQEAFEIFRAGHVGFSDFIAYEVVTDLRHTSYLKNATDIYTWANAGPGAIRGLNRITGRKITSKINSLQACKEMQYLLQESELYLPDHMPRLEMREIEHTLCEFDKYERIKTDKSFLRIKYPGV